MAPTPENDPIRIISSLDRLVMLITGASSLREVIAFPKIQTGKEPMVAPDAADPDHLEDLPIQLDVDEDELPEETRPMAERP